MLGKLSGRKALVTRLQQLGFELQPEELNEIFMRFKVRFRGLLSISAIYLAVMGCC